MDRKRVTVIRIGPVISTKKRKHCTEMCGAFFVLPAVYLNDPFREKCVWSTPQIATNAKYK